MSEKRVKFYKQSIISLDLERRVGAGDGDLHLGREGLLHVSQLGQDLASDNLLGVQLADMLAVAGQASEGRGPGNGGSAGATAAALNNGDLRYAQLEGLSDHGVLGHLALFQHACGNRGVGDLLHVLSTGHLLAHNLLLFNRERRAGLLNSVGEAVYLGDLATQDLAVLMSLALMLSRFPQRPHWRALFLACSSSTVLPL